jgi:pyruvate dehydrogenase E2 component (dihydrolipoamide acetyltransferase)
MATVVRMPKLSDTMTEGVLVAWHKKIGDAVKSGDLLAEIETDKAVMEFESYFNGTLLYAIDTGTSLEVDKVIAVLGKADEDWKAIIAESEGKANATASASTVTSTPVEVPFVPTATAESAKSDRLKASPLAKTMAKEEGIDLAKVIGSGDDGRIVKRDIEALLEGKTSQPETAVMPLQTVAAENNNTIGGGYEDVILSQMRKTIARRLSESKFSAPEFYLTMEITMDECMKTRVLLNELSKVKISFNDIVIKATAMALRNHPAINAAWLGDKIRYHQYVNMGVAVAVEEGLMVPVVRNADLKSLSQIATEVRELATKAAERKLQGPDMEGSTFTISNLGMFGIQEFTAIINPPNSCILAVGGISEKLVMKEGVPAVSHVMKVTLTCDHRVVDGALGAKFLQNLKELLENPMRMLV